MNKFSPRKLPGCLWKAAVNTINHDGIEHAGYLAFLSLLSLFPFLVLVVAIVGMIGQGEAGAMMISNLLQALPAHVAAGLKQRISEIISGPPQGLLTVSILGAVWTASSAVEGMRTILNRAYQVATPPAYWFRRSLSVFQLLVFTMVLVVGMLLMVIIPLSLQHMEGWTDAQLTANYTQHLQPVAYPATIAAMFLAVCFIYHLLPNIKQHLASVVPGAFIVVGLWIGAAHLFSLYLSNFNQVNLIYGSLGGIIAVLVFFYISNIIFIFGAEFNHQIAHMLGLRVVPREEVKS